MNSNVTKWGFGMAPLKLETKLKNEKAIISVKKFVEGIDGFDSKNLLDDISWVKGIFNRIIKQDQWDWFTVYMYLDYPTYSNIKGIVSNLSALRSAIKKSDDRIGKISLQQLKNKTVNLIQLLFLISQ